MQHHPFISLLLLILLMLLIYRVSTFELKTQGDVMFSYFIYLEVLSISFTHLYEVFDDFCF